MGWNPPGMDLRRGIHWDVQVFKRNIGRRRGGIGEGLRRREDEFVLTNEDHNQQKHIQDDHRDTENQKDLLPPFSARFGVAGDDDKVSVLPEN